ncbi:hypothetical protein CVT24_000154 [Panaeolus cyanescens]|uniref:Fe2OG dioxygenase domain-containing protein n=1 Tax=Panaeolus cyanescens TaxID=181874 RepID=A0A409VIY3_9AGAR|nr:hypothetical protein CVT24_000154 [Panaeolus cyanescens]
MLTPEVTLKRKRSTSETEGDQEYTHGIAGAVILKSSPTQDNKKQKLLKIDIPTSLNSGLEQESPGADNSYSSLFSDTDNDSLFGDLTDSSTTSHCEDDTVASRTAPSIMGMFFEPTIRLPPELADTVMTFCMNTYFRRPEDNQAMLFGRLCSPDPSEPLDVNKGLPEVLLDLLESVRVRLEPVLPTDKYELLFPKCPTMARQAIINLYQPGEGITPHVDLLSRYGDGIIGVSLGSGCAMRFDKTATTDNSFPSEGERHDLYLPERSVIVLSEDARYQWTHGIDKKTRDFVANDTDSTQGAWVERSVRLSVTYRWLLPGADVVGETAD